MRTARTTGLVLAVAGLLVSGCAGLGPLADTSGARNTSGSRTDQSSRPGLATERVSPQDAARLRRIIEPLARAADKPPARITVGILSIRA